MSDISIYLICLLCEVRVQLVRLAHTHSITKWIKATMKVGHGIVVNTCVIRLKYNHVMSANSSICFLDRVHVFYSEVKKMSHFIRLLVFSSMSYIHYMFVYSYINVVEHPQDKVAPFLSLSLRKNADYYVTKKLQRRLSCQKT